MHSVSPANNVIKAAWESALEVMVDSVFICDADGQIISFNKAFASFHRFASKEQCAKTVQEYPALTDCFTSGGAWLPFEHRPAALALRGEAGSGVELRVQRKDTGETWFGSYDYAPMRDESGTIIGAVVTCRDITQRKRDELALIQARDAAEAANRAKNAFLGTVSHELRTPLNAVIGFSELLLQGMPGKPAEEQIRPLTIIQRSGRQLLDLVQEILDLSSIEAGNLVLDVAPLDLRAVLEESSAALLSQAAERQLVLGPVECDDDTIVIADRARLAQVMRNLLSNAVKFTDTGSIVVRASIERQVARVVVEDTGIGIDSAHQGQLFKPFQRIFVPDASQRPGTGLGLAVSRRIVESMGGAIGVESEPGRGSRFWFTLPRAHPAARVAPQVAPQVARAAGSAALPCQRQPVPQRQQ